MTTGQRTPAEIIGHNIREAREARGKTVLEFAARMGVNPQSVYRWERGGTCPDTETQKLIAKELWTTVSELCKGV